MKTSDQINEISKALSQCQEVLKNPTKAATNPFFKSKYANLDSVIEAIKGPAAKFELSYISTVVEGEKGMSLATRLMHSSGQWIEDCIPLMGKLSDMQGVGSAITYGRRYSLQNLFGITGEDDDDGNSISNRAQGVQPRQQPRREDNGDKTKVLGAFIQLGIDKEGVSKILKKPFDTATQTDIINLRGIYSKISSGERTYESYLS